MALTRKQLHVATYAALCAAALLLVMFAPKRRRNTAPEVPAPMTQLGSGSGCEASELPKTLDAPPPAMSDPAAAKDETPLLKRARYRITACVLRKLWPTASLQFRWKDDGGGQFDLVFPNNAYRRVSVLSMWQLSSADNGVTVAEFVWLPHQRELPMPPMVVVRADGDGNISYYKAFVVDDEVRVSEERAPQWISAEDNKFSFSYEGDYGTAHIAWSAVLDVAAAEVIKRVPTRTVLANGEWSLTEERIEESSLIMSASGRGEVRSIRVRCESTSGANCVVSARDLIEQIQ